jgi:molybdopterin molybdotransferase
MKPAMNADWVGLREALETIQSAIQPIGDEPCPLRSSRGRVLAEDVVSPIDLPLWTNSAMDGFACLAGDVRHATRADPVVLRVVDDVPAGAFPRVPVTPGTATRVMTGAPIPDGADTVVRVEHTDGGTGGGGRVVRIHDGHDAGRNLRRQGEELKRGDIALRAGTPLTPAAVGVAAAMGRAELRVVRRPVVAVMTSGDELVDVDRYEEVMAGRRIVSSNSYTLGAQLEEIGCEVRYLGIAKDSLESLRSLLRQAEGCDALVTSAGISVGEHDHVKQALLELEAKVRFWRVRIRPGSPFAFGTIAAWGGIPWFGLPGNPVSSMVTFELFARPALLRMSGQLDVFPVPIRAVFRDDYRAPPGLTHLVRVALARDGSGEWEARTTGAQGSGILSSIVGAHGLMIVPEESEGAQTGERYDVWTFGAVRATEPPL